MTVDWMKIMHKTPLPAFLDAYNVPYETAPSEPKLAARDVAAQAREFTVLVECWK